MSRYIRPRSDLAAAAAEVTKQPWKKRPCGNPPSAPTGLTGSFDRAEGGRHNRIRALLRWAEVTTDTSGFVVKVLHYVVEMEHTTIDDPEESDWGLSSRTVVPGKEDADDNLKAHAVIKGIQGKVAYRYRVKVKITADSCDSAWSAYYVLGVPNADTPPPPYNVIVFENANDRLCAKWDAVTRPDDDDLYDDKINHFGAEVSQTYDFADTYDKERGIKAQRVSFKVKPNDDGGVFYIRVWSVSPDKDKSLRIPARIDPGNSDPEELPSPIRIGKGGADPGTVHKFACKLNKIPGLYPQNVSKGAARWILCDGASYKVADFPDLFAAIEYTWGGSGADFNVPDHRARKAVGVGTNYPAGGDDGLVEGDRDDDAGTEDDETGDDETDDSTVDDETDDSTVDDEVDDVKDEAQHGHWVSQVATDGPSATRGVKAGTDYEVAGVAHKHNTPGHNSNAGNAHHHGHKHPHRHRHKHPHRHRHHHHHKHKHQHDSKKHPRIHVFFCVKT